MSNNESPNLSDLEFALKGLHDRCVPSAVKAVRRMVVNRGPELGPYMRQLVRLVRLLELCSDQNKGYTDFLYVRVRAFTTQHFRRAITDADPSATAVRIEADRVVFLEEAMRSVRDNKPFDVFFGQMPRLATLLDLLHNTVRYTTLDDRRAARDCKAIDAQKGLFWPILTPEPQDAADEVARRVRSAFEAWLSQALTTSQAEKKPSTLIRKAKAVGSFLMSHSKWSADAIDDELIFAFWQDYASKDGDFKTYKQVARSILRYRKALSILESERQRTYSFGTGEGEIDIDRFADRDQIGPEGSAAADWESPLMVLRSDPCDEVKWLKENEYGRLANFLDFGAQAKADDEAQSDSDANDGVTQFSFLRHRRLPDGAAVLDFGAQGQDDDEAESDADANAGVVSAIEHPAQSALVIYIRLPDGSALMGPDRFELAFARTLLRTDVFGSAQAIITGRGRLKKRAAGAAAVADVLKSVDAQSYEDVAQEYTRIRDEVRDAALAALYHLGTEGDLSALVLISGLFGREAITHFTSAKHAGAVAIKAKLRDAFRVATGVPDETSHIVAACKHVASKMTKKGFKPENRSALFGSFPEAAPALVELLGELDRLSAHLERMPLRDMASEDRAMFERMLTSLYGA